LKIIISLKKNQKSFIIYIKFYYKMESDFVKNVY